MDKELVKKASWFNVQLECYKQSLEEVINAKEGIGKELLIEDGDNGIYILGLDDNDIDIVLDFVRSTLENHIKEVKQKIDNL